MALSRSFRPLLSAWTDIHNQSLIPGLRHSSAPGRTTAAPQVAALEGTVAPSAISCSLQETQAVLRALAEPNRLAILRLVWQRELGSGQIASRCDLSRNAVAEHLGLMERVGLLSRRRIGVRRLYRARPERIAALVAFIGALK